jgi:catechol 2,3-dioxygenase-like lactoylglutathione lyase family enzyme
MLKHFDHVTFVVRDPSAALAFLALLGFEETKSVVISGPIMARYMGVDGIEAEHRTLELAGATPRCEVQLLTYRQPAALPNPELASHRQLGFNHICFAVDDLDAEVTRLQARGVRLANELMEFHDRKLVFLAGPENIIVELAEWR